ncbi:MAG: hypothetical protein ACPG8W_22720 [Candidatus Promineifilaceae bacterium]
MTNQQWIERPHAKKKQRKPEQARPKPSVSFKRMSQLFVACPRCGYFLSGYRARMGVDALKTAVEQVKDVDRDWLHLGWHYRMLDLLERTYGCEIPADTLHFELRCGTCSRVLVLEESAEEAKSLRIQVMPRTRHASRD